MIKTDDVRNSLYIDEGEDEELLTNYINIATEYVKQAVGNEEAQTDKRFDGAVLLLVEMLYQNRGTDIKNIPLQVKTIITQLQCDY